MSITLLREPGYYGRPLFERQAWQLYGKAKFPNYDRFWQAYVVPRIRPTPPYIKFLDNVTFEERQIIRLHQIIFHRLSNIYDRKPLKNQPTELQKGRRLLFTLDKLNSICDILEKLLLILLASSNETSKENSVAKQYVRRLCDRQARIEATHPPGKLYSLDNIPPYPPDVTILLGELKAIHNTYDLQAFSLVAKQIRSDCKIAGSLKSFHANGWMPFQNPIHSITEADRTALQSILGDHDSAHEFVVSQSDQLLATINDLYGKQLLPRVQKHAL